MLEVSELLQEEAAIQIADFAADLNDLHRARSVEAFAFIKEVDDHEYSE